MKSNYKQLGQFIRQVDVRNSEGKEENLLGVSVQKKFIPSIANTVGTDFKKYKVVKKGQFTYIPDTSRRGDKIGIALLEDYEEGLVSNVYTVFEIIDEKQLIPEYLMLWFSRPEFDRYARFKSHGSVREVMDWDEMCKVELPVPPYEKQKEIVDGYKAITERIALKQKINDNLEQQAKLLYDYWFTQFDFPDENGKPYRSSGGKMVWNEQLKMEIPFSWICSKMENAIEAVRTGLNPRNNFQLGNGNIQYITVKNLCLNGSLDFSGCDTIDEQARQIVHRRSDIQRDDILFASIAPLGRCYLIQENPTNWDINESVFSIRYNSSVLTAEYLYMNLQSETFVKRATACSTGSIFKGIRINSLMDSEIILPPLSVTKEFSKEIKPLFALQKELDRETHTLIQLRDWLLPMLMNGQATISD